MCIRDSLKTSGLQDKALYDYTFARDNGINPEIKLAHNYVSNWEEMKGHMIWNYNQSSCMHYSKIPVP